MVYRTIPIHIFFITLFSHTSAYVVVTTLVGNGTAGYADGVGTSALVKNPSGLAFDKSGVLFVADRNNNRIRRVTLSGVVTTYAGGGSTTVTDSNGNPASFSSPTGLVFDVSGNLFIADLGNNRVVKISSANVFSVFAGNGTVGWADGSGSSVMFNAPQGITIDTSGNLYIPEWGGNKIRKITSSGVVSTLAGSVAGYADGVGSSAKFNHSVDAVADSSGNVYVVDYNNHMIRRITPSGNVTTLAGSSAGYSDGIGTAA